MNREWKAAWALVPLLAAGCGSNPVSDSPSYVTQAVTPSPVTAQAATSGTYQYTASFTVTLSEQGGVGVTLTDVAATVYEVGDSGSYTAVDGSNSMVSLTLPTNRIEANGTLVLPWTVAYTLPGGGRRAAVRVALSFVDDHRYYFSGTFDVVVN